MAAEKKGRIDAPNTPKARLARLEKEKEEIIEEFRASADEVAGDATEEKKGRIDTPRSIESMRADAERAKAIAASLRPPAGKSGDDAEGEKAGEAKTLDDKLDDLRDFVLGNRDIILGILNEASDEAPDLDRARNDTVGGALRRGIDSTGDSVRETFRAITSKEVQTHFVRMGLEFFMGMEALIRALPLPGVLEDAYEEVDAATYRTRETICENNPDCLYRPKRGAIQERPVDTPVRPSTTVRPSDPVVRPTTSVRPSDPVVRPTAATSSPDEPTPPKRNVRRKTVKSGDELEKIELG
ncbi:MAG: hypothetical protein GX224_04000 [Thermoplasmatales archaeon]|nr:hypothetical protein [Thermoplasmatales archaeon]